MRFHETHETFCNNRWLTEKPNNHDWIGQLDGHPAEKKTTINLLILSPCHLVMFNVNKFGCEHFFKKVFFVKMFTSEFVYIKR